MKQHEILYKFFQTPKDSTVKFCVNVQSDYKLNVLGVHYITLPKVGKLPKNWQNRTRHYIGGNDIKRIKLLEGIAGPYHPAAESPVRSLETIVPDSMDFEMHSAVNNVKEQVGSVNAYVRTKLGYKTDQELADALSAEQVDAVAMAIYNIEEKEQAIIIGDQTGIGKGRIAAAIIRYACFNGYKPVFMTEKPNLFSDIYRDIIDIGSDDDIPLLFNNSEVIVPIKYKNWSKLTEEEKEDFGVESEAEYEKYKEENQTEVVSKYVKNKDFHEKGKRLKPFIFNSKGTKSDIKDSAGNVIYQALSNAEKQTIFNSKKVPDDFKVIMLTYSQISSQKAVQKRDLLLKLSKNNILIMDESHNASGTSQTGEFLKQVVESSKGVVFLSATFAKRPDNMPLYAIKTAMSEASMSNIQLVEAIKRGGVALQEVLSSNLVSEGQMIRRERSFDGVEVNYISLDANGARDFGVQDKEQEHRAVADRITEVLRRIIEFQTEHITPVVDKMDEAVKAEMSEIQERQGTKNLGVDSPPFFSKLFNVVNQMLFSIKAEEVANRAIQRLKEGKKPVIAFANTMASFLESMENERGKPITAGNQVNTDFTEVLKRGLDGVLRITKKDAHGNSEKEVIKLSNLSEEAQQYYYATLNQIKNISTGISISPIDIIKHTLEEAGYSVAEVTGRSLEVQFTGKGMTGLVMPRKKENVNDAFRRFNNNQVDVLMINQAGSTGASAHAIVTPRVPLDKVKQRVMIMLQAELDINREVQKRGRINRTGQVYKPIYDYINSAIPAEKRLMMMLQKKLKSLDANTTSNQKNSEALMKSDDFLNKYGDRIVLEYLIENPEINQTLGDPLKLDGEKGENTEDAAHRVSGRVAVLTTDEQQKFYNDVLERYNQLVTYLIQTGEYDLEVESMDLHAETIESKVSVAGVKGGKSAFAGNTYLDECMVNNLRKPFSKVELDNAIQTALNGQTPIEIKEKLISDAKEYLMNRASKDEQDIIKKHELLEREITKEKKYLKLNTKQDRDGYIEGRVKEIKQGQSDAIKLMREKYNNSYGYIYKFFNFFTIGKPINYPLTESSVFGVFIGFKIDEKKNNPYAPSAIKARFAIANSLKYLEFVLSGEQGNKLQSIIGASYSMSSWQAQRDLERWDELCKETSAPRKRVFIYTGNILQAFTVAEGGKLISYTTTSGEVKKGILMPDGWQQKKKGGATRTIVPLITALKAIKSLTDGSMIETDNGVSFMRTYRGFKILTAGLSVQKYGWLVKNESILNFVTNAGGFQKQSSSWVADIETNAIDTVVSIIYDLTKATVGLSEGQMQAVADEIDTTIRKDKAPVFPRLVELEIRLFKMIEDDRKVFVVGMQGLGLPANAMTAFETLKKHHPLKLTDPKGKLIAEMVSEVADRTNNFKNPEAIGIDRIEVKPLLEKEKIATAEWLSANKTLRRSEADVVEWLAAKIVEMLSKTDVTPDKAKRIRIAKAKAKALILIQMQL